MPQFIRLVEQGDNSLHLIHKDHIIQVVHVPGSTIATVTTSDGKSFRIGDAEYQRFLEALTGTEASGR